MVELGPRRNPPPCCTWLQETPIIQNRLGASATLVWPPVEMKAELESAGAEQSRIG